MTMRLSEALILGEFAFPPSHGTWFKRDKEGICGACAVGRSCYAAGFNPNVASDKPWIEDPLELSKFMNEKWPWTITAKPPYPWSPETKGMFWMNGGGDDNRIMIMISNLYESFGMSMQEIAAWVATIEPHIDERKCETNEVSAQDEAVNEVSKETESQTVRN